MLITASDRSPSRSSPASRLWLTARVETWTPGTVSLQFVFCLQSINDDLDRVSNQKWIDYVDDETSHYIIVCLFHLYS